MISGGRIIEVRAVKKKDEVIEGMNVAVNIDNVSVEKEVIVVAYEYKITYLPDNAELVVRGELLASENEKDKKEIEEEWRKRKFLPNRFAEDVINAISYSGTAVGTILSFALNIPAPLNLPRAKIGAPPEKKGQAS
ncbi:MAG: hypothetical protein QW343_02605 [Candidatus Norongarragalinales archaeon]